MVTADPGKGQVTMYRDPEPGQCWYDSVSAQRTRPGPLARVEGSALTPTNPAHWRSCSHRLLHGESAATTEQRKKDTVRNKVKRK